MKKILFFLLIAFCIGTAMNCRKEATGTKSENALSSASTASDIIALNTQFGSFINAESSDEKITVSKKMGVTYVRNSIVVESYNGKAPMVDTYQDSGFKVLLNLNYRSVTGKNPSPFPTDMVKYRSLLEDILSKYTPEIAVIENEPANDGYYTGPIEDYFTELRTAIDVCHAHGVPVADGALHTGMVCILVYQDYVKRGLQSLADDFASRALSSSYLKAAQGKGNDEINAKLEKCKKMVAAYTTMSLDYINIHWYEPFGNGYNDTTVAAPGVAKEVADYLRRVTGKIVLTNEFGQTNQSPTLIASLVNEFRKANFAYAIVFSGTSGGGIGAKPLHSGSNLLPNGIAYRNAVAVKK
jgi:hypothetical protein